MENKHIARSILVLGLIVVGMFVFAYLKKSEIEQEAVVETTNQNTETESAYGDIARIDAKHFFIEGVHTLVGEILMPTPCDLLNWDTRVQESFPETAVIDFTVINNSEMCSQVVTPQRFKVTFEASEKAVVGVTFEGRAVEVNLIPPAPGETPLDFELFIKG